MEGCPGAEEKHIELNHIGNAETPFVHRPGATDFIEKDSGLRGKVVGLTHWVRTSNIPWFCEFAHEEAYSRHLTFRSFSGHSAGSPQADSEGRSRRLPTGGDEHPAVVGTMAMTSS